MKAEFELTVDEKTGEPFIKFSHHDRDKNIEQLLLGVFVGEAKTKGLILKNTGGHLECGTSNSQENYEIRITAR